MSDFSYTTDGTFYVIYPNNPNAEATVRAMLEKTPGGNKLLRHEFNAFRRQARQAGYSIRKQKPSKKISDDELLSELG